MVAHSHAGAYMYHSKTVNRCAL